ncbi:MAG: RNA 3'-terminal phosphate cyclase [Pirellulaceae bacterium]
MSAAGHLDIDGAQGEGGGQIVRSAISLSLVTGRPIRIRRIRAGRSKAGLLRQHLTAVHAAAEISAARVEGAVLRSSELRFAPGPVRAGNYTFDVGSAGSTTLVLQTLLPALMVTDAPSQLVLVGGTHNPWAPPVDFLQRTFLPLLAQLGPQVDLKLERFGFFPAGGGRIRVGIVPSRLSGGLSLLASDPVLPGRVRVLLAHLPEHIGRRECQTVLSTLGWDAGQCVVETTDQSDGPGNAVLVELRRGGVTEVFVGFGQRGVSAERVAGGVAEQVRKYLNADAPVGEYLADQLLLPLSIGAHQGGGSSEFRASHLSSHARTHIEILHSFLDIHVAVHEEASGSVRVSIAAS